MEVQEDNKENFTEMNIAFEEYKKNHQFVEMKY